MGQVWAGTEVASEARVALKLMRKTASEHRARFEREGELGRSVVHPNVRRVREVVDWDGAPVMVMDLLDGQSLAERIGRGPKLGLDDAATVLVQVISAVGTMHALGVVHRDIKPENVFLVEGALERAMVLDLGIAKHAEAEPEDLGNAPTATGTPLGTPSYMAPEQMLGEPSADDRVDVWAIGVLAHELVSGVLPTAADNVGQVMKRVLMGDLPSLAASAPWAPRAVAEIVDQALRASPEVRASLADLLDVLLPFARVVPPRFGPPKTRRALPTGERTGPTVGAAVARHNLPRAATSFVGRTELVRDVRAKLGPGALVTLTGAGGSGKTRLAIECARAVSLGYEGGVWLVDLGRVAEGSRVEAAVVAAIPSSGGPSSLAARLEELGGRAPTLLLLDNCEHVLDDVASVIDAILRACTNVAILATSREAIGIAGEEAFAVEPLVVPTQAELGGAIEALAAVESVALFVERARQSDRSFAPSNEEVRAVAQICRKLDGLPLAIELAAARVRVLGVLPLARRIAEHLELLSSGVRGTSPRHKTLRAAIAWSHELLTPGDQRVFRALGVFEGSFSLDAVCSVASADAATGDGGARVLDVVARLVDKSLVLVERRGGEPRFRLLETVRAFAREELERAGESAEVRDRHADFFVAQAEKAVHAGRLSTEVADAELDDVLAADRHAVGLPGGSAKSLRLLIGLERYIQHAGLYALGIAWADRALSDRASLPPDLVARGLHSAAAHRIFSGAPEQARPFAEEALAVARPMGDPRVLGAALAIAGLVADRTMDLVTAEARYLEALACFRASGDQGRAAATLNNLGDIAFGRGDVALALARQSEALAHARRASDDYMLPIVLAVVALLSARTDRLVEARAELAEAVAVSSRTRAQRAGADTLDAAVHVAERSGEPTLALRWYAASEALRARIRAPTDEYYAVLHREAVARAAGAQEAEVARATSEAGSRLGLEHALEEVATWLSRAPG
jgi:non-specific serine/threonine protein kinase